MSLILSFTRKRYSYVLKKKADAAHYPPFTLCGRRLDVLRVEAVVAFVADLTAALVSFRLKASSTKVLVKSYYTIPLGTHQPRSTFHDAGPLVGTCNSSACTTILGGLAARQQVYFHLFYNSLPFFQLHFASRLEARPPLRCVPRAACACEQSAKLEPCLGRLTSSRTEGLPSSPSSPQRSFCALYLFSRGWCVV